MWYKVCQWLATGLWFSPCTLVSFTNKTDRHDIAEILLKVALNTITLTLKLTQIQIKNVIAIKQIELGQMHTLPNFGPGAFYFWGIM